MVGMRTLFEFPLSMENKEKPILQPSSKATKVINTQDLSVKTKRAKTVEKAAEPKRLK